MKKIMFMLAATSMVTAAPVCAQVAVTSLESSTTVPSTNDGKTFTSNPSDNRVNDNLTMSSATITASSPISSNGSIEIDGKRSRVYNDMTGLSISANSLEGLTADYRVEDGSPDGIQSPAFRVYVSGSNAGYTGLSELIWEAANNGGYTLGQQDSLSSSDLFWRQIVGQSFDGTGGIGSGGYVLHTLAEWGDILGGTVLAIGVGNGGCPLNCSTFKAYADNLSLSAGGQTYAYDFQAAVPEPATWAMMLLGFGGIGASMRRQRRSSKLAQLA